MSIAAIFLEVKRTGVDMRNEFYLIPEGYTTRAVALDRPQECEMMGFKPDMNMKVPQKGATQIDSFFEFIDITLQNRNVIVW